ncbi:hypothetical protein H261_08238 [Paramagnetospirillum caucaseum]|uniref:Uncharacterized protein n=1 Tax=Paramagnetospirillum caucaseum TaxID=1244869 RepID=M2YBR8_9PROT|nr:hypothetical protein [Paramagnetospirillum caucaseum]EME70456.1 hypothetical protein H261_08238 [Paramagnetospirillum caucaseum]
MADKKIEGVQSIEALYALIEHNRLTDEVVAERVFQNEVNAAINTITEISTVASARIMTDTQVASAKIQIDAEVQAARLAADAEMAVAKIKSRGGRQSQASVKAAIVAIGNAQSERLSDAGKQSIHEMVIEAEAAIAKLRQLADAAIEEIHRYATNTTARMQAAAVATARMKAFQTEEHTRDEIVAEGAKAADFVSLAAESASRVVQQSLDATLRNIRAVTDEACANIKSSVENAVERIEAARIKAQARIDEAVRQATKT